MNPPQVPTKMLRSFGFLMGGMLSLFTLVFAYKEIYKVAGTLAVIASCFILFALVAPRKLGKIHSGWMKFGGAMGRFNSKVILGVMFLFFFSIFRFFLIILRKDFLKRDLDASRESYWENRETQEIDVARYEKQY
jgi:saxitoxin biosynthesis operon SxtJ-like protein